ncbi:Ribosomal RNA small subunit methyltransferase H [Rubripirellula amarantea]|uniref:Ribosomal RNA small subunit methyltransferase H n=1 Tax=Rubripirellula amarantea TaxID=2527999 RepID=A0A5C5WKJ2_9BACT|nr:16S rRNA (cytosine(1402)-N(4))-methyltransferase RsmH [Rubripirellula amarantea]TWT50599.1 Ribosomal RNA small subunit methyltransferase H [Rubripirellula amarantea]
MRLSPVPVSDSVHVSVMPDEIVHWVSEIDPKTIVDGTYGGGGHSDLLLKKLPDDDVRIFGLDRDPEVSERVDSQPHDKRLTVFLGSYEATPKAMAAMDADSIDAMVLDLGLSSDQLADRSRGFSYTEDGPLDLRFDPENGHPAYDWLAWKKEEEIANAIYQFGEERYSRRIAREIIARRRKEDPVKTVDQLVDVCRRCVPRSKNHDIHPATRTFQALRIVVNDELGILTRTLAAAPDWLRPGGRMVVISFHSLEDRIVKNAFRDDERWNILTKKPLRPTDAEVAANPRARSAKLRVAERV